MTTIRQPRVCGERRRNSRRIYSIFCPTIHPVFIVLVRLAHYSPSSSLHPLLVIFHVSAVALCVQFLASRWHTAPQMVLLSVVRAMMSVVGLVQRRGSAPRSSSFPAPFPIVPSHQEHILPSSAIHDAVSRPLASPDGSVARELAVPVSVGLRSLEGVSGVVLSSAPFASTPNQRASPSVALPAILPTTSVSVARQRDHRSLVVFGRKRSVSRFSHGPGTGVRRCFSRPAPVVFRRSCFRSTVLS